MKQYDRAYFDRWYRDPNVRVATVAAVARKVHLVVSVAEALLERRVRSVLDVGCGEGAWQPALAKVRPRARYVGVDPSAYAVERFGRRRHLRLGAIDRLDEVVPLAEGPFDLVVCVDVLGYVPDAQVAPGLKAIAARLGGVALLGMFTALDPIEGDVEHYRRRSPSRYERWLAAAGLARIGPNLFAGPAITPALATFEAPLAPRRPVTPRRAGRAPRPAPGAPGSARRR
jgi:SAM-dependent methyltransferase